MHGVGAGAVLQVLKGSGASVAGIAEELIILFPVPRSVGCVVVLGHRLDVYAQHPADLLGRRCSIDSGAPFAIFANTTTALRPPKPPPFPVTAAHQNQLGCVLPRY